MDQQLGAVIQLQTQSVQGGVDDRNRGVCGSDHQTLAGQDADAAAQCAGCKHVIGHLVQRVGLALNRGLDLRSNAILGQRGLCRSGLCGGGLDGSVLEAHQIGQNSSAHKGHHDADDISHELAEGRALAPVRHNGQDAVVGKAGVHSLADAHDAAAHSAGNDSADHGLLQTQVTAVDRRLSNADQPCGQRGGSSHLLQAGILGLEHDAQSSAGLREVCSTGEAHQGVGAGHGHIVQADGQQSAVCAEDNADAPQAAHDDTAQNGAEAVQCGVEPLDDVADIDAHGADDHQHDGNHDQQGQAGDKDQLKDFRYDLIEQPFQKRQ